MRNNTKIINQFAADNLNANELNYVYQMMQQSYPKYKVLEVVPFTLSDNVSFNGQSSESQTIFLFGDFVFHKPDGDNVTLGVYNDLGELIQFDLAAPAFQEFFQWRGILNLIDNPENYPYNFTGWRISVDKIIPTGTGTPTISFGAGGYDFSLVLKSPYVSETPNGDEIDVVYQYTGQPFSVDFKITDYGDGEIDFDSLFFVSYSGISAPSYSAVLSEGTWLVSFEGVATADGEIDVVPWPVLTTFWHNESISCNNTPNASGTYSSYPGLATVANKFVVFFNVEIVVVSSYGSGSGSFSAYEPVNARTDVYLYADVNVCAGLRTNNTIDNVTINPLP